MLELDFGMMAWTWITFAVVLFILYKVALKPILSAIENREESVKDDLDTAKRQRDETEELLNKHQMMISEAESEAQKILKETQDLAQKTRLELLEEARSESADMIEKAKKPMHHP